MSEPDLTALLLEIGKIVSKYLFWIICFNVSRLGAGTRLPDEPILSVLDIINEGK